jgi:hypothetical protein
MLRKLWGFVFVVCPLFVFAQNNTEIIVKDIGDFNVLITKTGKRGGNTYWLIIHGGYNKRGGSAHGRFICER